jgi:hypothetical protein
MKGYKIDYKVKTTPRKMKHVLGNMLESFEGEQDAKYFKPVFERMTRKNRMRPL